MQRGSARPLSPRVAHTSSLMLHGSRHRSPGLLSPWSLLSGDGLSQQVPESSPRRGRARAMDGYPDVRSVGAPAGRVPRNPRGRMSRVPRPHIQGPEASPLELYPSGCILPGPSPVQAHPGLSHHIRAPPLSLLVTLVTSLKALVPVSHIGGEGWHVSLWGSAVRSVASCIPTNRPARRWPLNGRTGVLCGLSASWRGALTALSWFSSYHCRD